MDIINCDISVLEKKLVYPYDIFICCGSYENRCLTIPTIIEPENIAHALVVENKNLSSYVGINSQQLRDRFGCKSVDVATDSTNPLITADNMQRSIKEHFTEKPQRYLIDITTFRHESLLILLSLLRQMTKKNDCIDLLYVSAADYSIGDKLEDKWLSKGVAAARSILGYSGDLSPSKKMHLIILVGFEYQRALTLIDILEPDKISLGHGAISSSTDEKHKPAQHLFYDILTNIMAVRKNVNNFEFSCSDPIETKNAILTQAKKYSDYNIVVAPMNTKLSTVGAGLATFISSEIQVCYAQAEQYNYHGYSSPGKNCYMFELSKYLW